MNASRDDISAEARRCIYCLVTKPISEFNEEHVLPKGLGTFGVDTPVLDCVCSTCNAALGADVISPFLRRSLEGLLRYGYGQRPLRMKASEQERRARIDEKHIEFDSSKLPPLMARLKGLHLLGFESPRRGMLRCLPQVGLWPNSLGLPDFFTIAELEAGGLDLSSYRCPPGSPALVACETEAEQERLLALAKSFGADIVEHIRIRLPERFPGEMKITLGPDELRIFPYIGINVIAFYLGPEVALDPALNDVRKFVRGDGEGRALEFVAIPKKQPPILGPDRQELLDSHVVIVDWDDARLELVALVSLFNMHYYRVKLSRGYAGVWRPDWRLGRSFDWRSKTVRELRPFATGLL